VIVPEQHGYPQYFVVRAHVATPATEADPITPLGFDELMIITKASAEQTWKLALEVTFDPTLLPSHPALVAPARPAARRGSTAARRRLSELAAYYQSWFATGGAPNTNVFTPGPGTTIEGAQIAGNEPGVTLQRTPLSATSRVYAVTLQGGNTLGCGAIDNLTIATPRPGGYLYQPPDRSNWGEALAPGNYAQVRTLVQRQVCIAHPARAGRMLVYGGRPTLQDVTGIPSRNAQEPTGSPTA
jgi:hypothetical protein